MNLTPYVESLRRELLVAADAGGDEARTVAQRLTGPLEAATRLVLFEALSDAASEITRELAPGSVDVRLRSREPEFVVSSPAPGPSFEDRDEGGPASIARDAVAAGDGDDQGTARMTLRLPDPLKVRIEEAARREGLSVNAWLVRAISTVLEPGDREPRSNRGHASGGGRYTGWVR